MASDIPNNRLGDLLAAMDVGNGPIGCFVPCAVSKPGILDIEWPDDPEARKELLYLIANLIGVRLSGAPTTHESSGDAKVYEAVELVRAAHKAGKIKIEGRGIKPGSVSAAITFLEGTFPVMFAGKCLGERFSGQQIAEVLCPAPDGKGWDHDRLTKAYRRHQKMLERYSISKLFGASEKT